MYDQFPWLFKWIASRREFHRLGVGSREMYLKLISHIKKTLNPNKCRGIADAFLAHKQSLEVRKVQSINLTANIFPSENKTALRSNIVKVTD